MSGVFSRTGGSGSPVKLSVSSGFESTPLELRDLRKGMAHSMEGLFLGPMPIKRFFDDFLSPLPSSVGVQTRSGSLPRVPPLSKDHFARFIEENIPENQMYEPYMDAINDKRLIPGFQIVNTSFYADKDMTNGPRIKPDPSVYRKDLDVSEKVTQFGELELHSELKAHNYDDAFVDHSKDKDRRYCQFESSTAAGTGSRGQLIHYATEWFARQHRRHAFTIFLFGKYVRFIRWDRAGAVVSERFNFRKDCSLLAEFLWRFSHLDDVGRGRDPFVRRATPQEAEITYRELEEWDPKVDRPVVVFTVPGEDGEGREFLAWGCLSEPRSLTGRCTRTYPVYEIATKKKYLLKDGWRAHTLAPEAEILRELRKKEVEHVPVYICGGDVGGGVTKTDLYVTVEEENESWQDRAEGESHDDGTVPVETANEASVDEAEQGSHVSTPKLDGSWKCGKSWRRVVQRFLHRFVSDVIGKPLRAFTSSRHMLIVVSHAFIGSWQAYERCGIIHRDVSANNILITSSGGILNDWDMAKKETDILSSRRHERTGTWEFMSSLLLTGHHTAHTIQDDMESFVLVVIYNALRYLPHNRTERTSYILNNVFNHRERLSNGDYGGGEARMTLFLNRAYIGRDFRLLSPPLQRWVRTAIVLVKQWIEAELAKSEPEEGPTDLQLIVNKKRAATQGVLPPPCSTASEPPAPIAPLELSSPERLAKYFDLCLQATDWPALADEKPHDIFSVSGKRVHRDELSDIGGSLSSSKPSASGVGAQGP